MTQAAGTRHHRDSVPAGRAGPVVLAPPFARAGPRKFLSDQGVDTAGPAVSTPMAPPPDREAAARKEAGVGIGLADDLRHVRTALIKAYLAGVFAAAFDLMLFQMGRSVFTFGYKPHALDITVRETADRPMTRMNDADFEN